MRGVAAIFSSSEAEGGGGRGCGRAPGARHGFMYWCPCKGCRVLMKVTNKGNTQKNSSSWGPGQSPAQLGQAIALPIPPSPASVPESIPESSAIRVLICWGVFYVFNWGDWEILSRRVAAISSSMAPRRGAARRAS